MTTVIFLAAVLAGCAIAYVCWILPFPFGIITLVLIDCLLLVMAVRILTRRRT